MIKNETQYRVTKNQAAKFAQSLAEFTKQPATGMHPIRRKAHLDSLQSQHEELVQELTDYETLKKGHLKSFQVETFDDLPLALIKARIALGLSQKDLADLMGLKEQQIQRYEATSYAGASYDRLKSIVRALKLSITETVLMPESILDESIFFENLEELGFSREFTLQRLLPKQLADTFNRTKISSENTTYLLRAASIVGGILGISPAQLVSERHVELDYKQLQGTRFKRTANSKIEKIAPYTLYARSLAITLLNACKHLNKKEIPTDYNIFRSQVIANYKVLTFETTLRYVWDLGIPVLPLNDSKHFHGACWRIDGRNIIVLKQKTKSPLRWLFDLIHEVRHAALNPEQMNFDILEDADNINSQTPISAEEKDANIFAGQVLLKGKAIQLANEAIDLAEAKTERLKSAVIDIANREGIEPGTLANYLAFQLMAQHNTPWWGVANNLQPVQPDIWQTARKVLFENARFTDLPEVEKELLLNALQ